MRPEFQKKHPNLTGNPQNAPRCQATSKRTGLQCRGPAMKGKKVCRMHGGKGGAPKGSSNARKHGRYSLEHQVQWAALGMMLNLCIYELSGGTRSGRWNRFMHAIAALPPDRVVPTLRLLIGDLCSSV
jgi:hypothetical protein